MYKVGNIQPSVVIDLPNCMYKMKNIQESNVSAMSVSANKSVEQRQQELIQRLTNLRIKADELLKKGFSSTTSSNVKVTKPVTGVINDIVIYANPKDTPLSILVFYELLQAEYEIYPSLFIHSSVSEKDVPEKYKKLFSSPRKERHECHMALTLIFKDISTGPVLVNNLHSQVELISESSILRYLSCGSSVGCDRKDPVHATTVDYWLDNISRLRASNDIKTLLDMMNTALSKQQYLVGDKLTIADIYAWSALKRVKQNQPMNVKKHIQILDSNPVFSRALAACL